MSGRKIAVRFLARLSYIGTQYSGLNDQSVERSVCTYIERALYQATKCKTKFHLSSITNIGVHALCTSGHFTVNFSSLSPHSDSFIWNIEKRYLSNVNKQLIKEEIRFMDIKQVPIHFDATNDAILRKYIYRLAIFPPSKCISYVVLNGPPAEISRTYIIRGPFYLKKAKEVCKLFMEKLNIHALRRVVEDKGEMFIRFIDEIEIIKGEPFCNPIYDSLYDGVLFYDICISGRSLQCDQVLQIVSCICGVGSGITKFEEVKQYLDKKITVMSNLLTAPSSGLYLALVNYPLEAFDFNLTATEKREFIKKNYSHIINSFSN